MNSTFLQKFTKSNFVLILLFRASDRADDNDRSPAESRSSSQMDNPRTPNPPPVTATPTPDSKPGMTGSSSGIMNQGKSKTTSAPTSPLKEKKGSFFGKVWIIYVSFFQEEIWVKSAYFQNEIVAVLALFDIQLISQKFSANVASVMARALICHLGDPGSIPVDP